MNEQEWLTSADPADMLALLGRGGPLIAERSRFVWSNRKLRLFACACCRQVWHLLTDARSRRAVEALELVADCGEETAAVSVAIVQGRDPSHEFHARRQLMLGADLPAEMRARWNAADAVAAVCDALGPLPDRRRPPRRWVVDLLTGRS